MTRYIIAFALAMLVLFVVSRWYAEYRIHHMFDHFTLPT